MKIKPVGDVEGVDLPVALVSSRRRLARAVEEDDAIALEEHLDAWRTWIVRVENERISPAREGEARFAWTCGSATSARFETACAAYACGRTLFHLRQYARAHARFGLALEETMQCRDRLPLTSEACGAFRLRCLVRAQRLAICEVEIADDPRRVLRMANWLAAAAEKYSRFPGAQAKEPIAAGESLAAAARAISTRDPRDAKKAREWSRNPFAADADRAVSGEQPAAVVALATIESTEGEFDWERFVSSDLYSA